MKKIASISHDRSEESPESKARWFRSLSMEDRMEMLCSFTDIALSVAPSLQDRKYAQPIAGHIQVISVAYQGQDFFILSKEDLIASKRAAGRAVDLEDVRLLELPVEEGSE